MQVSNVNNNIIQIKSQGTSSPFKSGTQIKATVTQVNSDGTVVLESDKGVFTASNTSNYGLNVGDTVSLIVTEPSYDGSAATTAITQINGQPIDQNVSLSELHLIDLGVMPNATNMRLYNILNKLQFPLTKEFIVNLKNVFAKLPGITDEQAAFLAANNIEPTQENLNALTNVGNLHSDIEAMVSEVTQQVIADYGISNQSLEQIISILNDIIQPQNETADIPIDTNVLPGTENLSSEGQIAEVQTPLPNPEIQLTPESVLSSPVDNSAFIPDKSQATTALTNYIMSALDIPEAENEAVVSIAPKLAETVTEAVMKQVDSNPEVTLKSISEFKLPDTFPVQLRQAISALPNETQRQITHILPKMLNSSKEFLSIRLIDFAKEHLNLKITKEISGEVLKTSAKNINSNINSILTDKPGPASQSTVTSLKLSDNTMNFIQIPITINEFKSSAEIYVVKRDNKKELSLANGIKVVFALNTEHLGRIESIISANIKDLNLNIRVESPNVQTIVQRELSYLKSLLSATPFNLSLLKVTMIDKPVSVLNAHTLFGYKQLDITV